MPLNQERSDSEVTSGRLACLRGYGEEGQRLPGHKGPSILPPHSVERRSGPCGSGVLPSAWPWAQTCKRCPRRPYEQLLWVTAELCSPWKWGQRMFDCAVWSETFVASAWRDEAQYRLAVLCHTWAEGGWFGGGKWPWAVGHSGHRQALTVLSEHRWRAARFPQRARCLLASKGGAVCEARIRSPCE